MADEHTASESNSKLLVVSDVDSLEKYKDLDIPEFGEDLNKEWLIDKWDMFLEMLPVLYSAELYKIYTECGALRTISELDKSTNVILSKDYIRLHALLINKEELRTQLETNRHLSLAFENLQAFWKQDNDIAQLKKCLAVRRLSEEAFMTSVAIHLFKKLNLKIDAHETELICSCSAEETLSMKKQVAIGNDETWNGYFDLLVNEKLNIHVAFEIETATDPDEVESKKLLLEFQRNAKKLSHEKQTLMECILLGFSELKENENQLISTTVLLDRNNVLLMLYNCKDDILLHGDYLKYQWESSEVDNFKGHIDVFILFMWVVSHFSMLTKPFDRLSGVFQKFPKSGFREKMRNENKLKFYERLSLKEYQIGFPHLQTKRPLIEKERPRFLFKRQKSS